MRVRQKRNGRLVDATETDNKHKVQNNYLNLCFVLNNYLKYLPENYFYIMRTEKFLLHSVIYYLKKLALLITI